MAFGTEPRDAGNIPISSVYGTGNTFPALQGAPGAYVDSSSNAATAVLTSVAQPQIVQKAVNKSTGSVASLTIAYATNVYAGNSLIVSCAVGNGTAPTITDTLGNVYKQIVQQVNGTALNTAIFMAVVATAGANTVTVTNGGTTASIAAEIYEVYGLYTPTGVQPDQTISASGTSGTAATVGINATYPMELSFVAVGIGTAAQTITAGAGWTNDSGQQSPTTPAGLFSFIAMSQLLSAQKVIIPQATFTSEPWAIAVAVFKPMIDAISGTMAPQSATSGGSTPSHTMTAATTNATLLKGAPGQIYGLSISNAAAAARYFKLYNVAVAPTVGTTPVISTIQVPASGTVIRAYPIGLSFSVGIAWAITAVITDADTTAVALNDCSIDIDYS